ncbi:protein of unknown function [Vibrio tapetis subsp. tapetis]|uniref:Uncharacterized protein n=1 Tax=Vibrio tapetis subsp. tapetis TaxID=1671868 RepID=A0A2N8ZKA6_9VIBR|nr:protein of unknown function [Vibrio tapetis subsp. tapetis]
MIYILFLFLLVTLMIKGRFILLDGALLKSIHVPLVSITLWPIM